MIGTLSYIVFLIENFQIMHRLATWEAPNLKILVKFMICLIFLNIIILLQKPSLFLLRITICPWNLIITMWQRMLHLSLIIINMFLFLLLSLTMKLEFFSLFMPLMSLKKGFNWKLNIFLLKRLTFQKLVKMTIYDFTCTQHAYPNTKGQWKILKYVIWFVFKPRIKEQAQRNKITINILEKQNLRINEDFCSKQNCVELPIKKRFFNAC